MSGKHIDLLEEYRSLSGGFSNRLPSQDPDGSERHCWTGDEERLVEHFHQLAGRITRQ
jgi:hypothetical protein